MIAKSYSAKTLYFIVFAAIIKIIIAPFFELGNDEVYYWTYALQPDWNHFDHPPMVGLLIRLTSLNLYWVSELSLRLGSILGAAVSSWFVFKTASIIANERTGWFATLIYNASVYTGFIAGFFILPDSPQMPFYTGALLLMAYILFDHSPNKKTIAWLSLGFIIGLALLSKVHALFLWAGFGLFILLNKRNVLLNWRLYASVFITTCFILPIAYWNWKNNFITYQFHSNRVTHTGIKWDALLSEILGEFAYQNPIVYVVLIIAIIALLRKKITFPIQETAVWLFCMSIPMLIVFWGVSMFNNTLPHWSGPAFIPLFFIAALYLDKYYSSNFPGLIKAAIGLVLCVLIAGMFVINLSPVNFGSKNKDNYGEYCPTLDLSGWNKLGINFSALVKSDVAENKMQSNALLIATAWFPAGHLEFYVSRQSGIPLIGIGLLNDLHKFAWLNKERPALVIGGDAYCIVPSNIPIDVRNSLGGYFKEIQQPVIIPQYRGKGIVRYFYVYRLRSCIKLPPASL